METDRAVLTRERQYGREFGAWDARDGEYHPDRNPWFPVVGEAWKSDLASAWADGYEVGFVIERERMEDKPAFHEVQESYRERTAGHWRVIPSSLIYVTVWDSKVLAEESAQENTAWFGHECLGIYPHSGEWLMIIKLREPESDRS